MIAALPMYDRPETSAANDILWMAIRTALRADGIEAPHSLTRPDDPWTVWRAPDLLLAQTCGLPFRSCLHESVALVASPDHGLPGCPPGHYFSVLVCRRHGGRIPQTRDFDGATLAYNEAVSQSGWAAPWAHFAALGLGIGARIATGSHRASALAVAEGRADFAAIDAVTWALIERHDAIAAKLAVFDRTAPTPALPFITAKARPARRIAVALRRAVASLSPRTRAALLLKGVTRLDAARYLALPIPPAP